MNKYIAFFIVTIIVVGVGLFYFRNDSSENVAVVEDIKTEEGNMVTEYEEELVEQDESIIINSIDDANYILDAEASTLGWEAARIVGSSHTGTVAFQDGSVVWRDDKFQKGAFIIDMTKIIESKNNERFLGHIRADDFFAVDLFPTATLEITDIKKEMETPPDEYIVVGDLTIRDKTSEISFAATINPREGGLDASATFSINRTQWGITYDSSSLFKQLGDKAIKDEIEFDLDLNFKAE